MRHVSIKFFALPVVMFFLLAMTSFSVATSYAANVKGGVGLAPFNAESIDAVEAAKLVLTKDAVVVDFRDPYSFELFNVSISDSANMGIQTFLNQLVSGDFSGLPIVGIVDETSEVMVRQVLNTVSSLMSGVELFFMQLNPSNVSAVEKAGFSVNTFKNISFDELPGYAALTKSVAQAGNLSAVQAALDRALTNPTVSTVNALDAAILSAYQSGAISSMQYAQLRQAVAGSPDIQIALAGIQNVLGQIQPPTPGAPAPTPAPTPGVGVITPAPTPVPGELTPPAAPTPVPAPVEEVVPPAPTPAPIPAPTEQITMNDVLMALNNALANANEQNIAALNDALDRAHDAGIISDVAYNQALQLLDGLTGTSGALQASVNEILQALQQIQMALLGVSAPGEPEIVPPVTPVVPSAPSVSEECINSVYAIVGNYPDLESYNVRAMVTDVVSTSATEACLLYDLVVQVNSRVEPIYSQMVSKGLFPNLLNRRDIINYDRALDDGLRQAALADGLITQREANADERLDNMFRRKDARHIIPLAYWLPTYVTTVPRDVLIRVLRGRENPLNALGQSLNDIWTNGINFETGRRAR